jgi:hypothetical protein
VLWIRGGQQTRHLAKRRAERRWVLALARDLVICRGEAFADGAGRPFAAMQATMSALYDRPGVSG